MIIRFYSYPSRVLCHHHFCIVCTNGQDDMVSWVMPICTDIKATVAKKTLCLTLIFVVCIVLYEVLLQEELLYEELLYSSVSHDFMVVSCWSLYQKYPHRK